MRGHDTYFPAVSGNRYHVPAFLAFSPALLARLLERDAYAGVEGVFFAVVAEGGGGVEGEVYGAGGGFVGRAFKRVHVSLPKNAQVRVARGYVYVIRLH